MSALQILGLILGSAGAGALISSLVNGLFNWWAKKAELQRRDMEITLKLTEMKHQQLIAAQEMYTKSGRDAGVDFFDPLVSVIEYDKGIKEYRKTGRWAKGEAGHGKASGGPKGGTC